ncbi:MAG: efflux RND transporter periplasmic adaptor subunit, partial [Aquabacterium sp.]
LAGPVAASQLAQARANAAAAAAERERSEDLFRQGFIGQARLDEARRAASVASSLVEAAQAQAQANLQGPELDAALAREAEARAALDVARSRLAQMRITAPTDGVVLVRLAEPGQIVQPGTRLLELSLDGALQLVAQVDEKYLSQITPGQPATVLADAFPAQRFAAQVASVAPGVDAQRGSVEVKFALASPPAFLRSDLTLSIEVETARRAQALVLPVQALRAGDSVLVVEDGRAVARPLRIGIRTLQALEVLQGLKAGEAVVLTAGIEPGQRVRAVAAAPRAGAGGAANAEAMNSAVQSMGR